MPRSYDADLCRLKGWEPGSILRFEVAVACPGAGFAGHYVLTSIGRRAVLVSSVLNRWDPHRQAWIEGELELDTREQRHSGSLHQYVITKVGEWDFETGGFEFFEGTEERAEFESVVQKGGE
jgi:hypothetical protein